MAEMGRSWPETLQIVWADATAATPRRPANPTGSCASPCWSADVDHIRPRRAIPGVAGSGGVRAPTDVRPGGDLRRGPSLAAFPQRDEGAQTRRLGTAHRLPGWDVHDVVAHVVTFEAFLDGEPAPAVDPEVTGVADPTSATRSAASTRRGSLLAGRPPGICSTGWTTSCSAAPVSWPRSATRTWPSWVGARSARWPFLRFLQVRALDVWFHEQDIREATGRPARSDRDVGSGSSRAHPRPRVRGRSAGPTRRTDPVCASPSTPTTAQIRSCSTSRWSTDVEGVVDGDAVAHRDDRRGARSVGRLVGGRRPPGGDARRRPVSLDGDVELGRRGRAPRVHDLSAGTSSRDAPGAELSGPADRADRGPGPVVSSSVRQVRLVAEQGPDPTGGHPSRPATLDPVRKPQWHSTSATALSTRTTVRR